LDIYFSNPCAYEQVQKKDVMEIEGQEEKQKEKKKKGKEYKK
jgi:hypothetical protein